VPATARRTPDRGARASSPARLWRAAAVAVIASLAVSSAAAAAPARKLVVGTKSAAPFAIRGADGSWSGISIWLWQEIAAELGLDYELKETDLTGLLSGLEDGSLDVSVAALTMTSEREAICDFSHPFYSSGLGIATSSTSRSGWLTLVRRFLSPEFLQVLAALALVLFAAGFLVWVFERRSNPEQFGPTPGKGLASAFYWSAVTMTTVGYGDLAPRTLGGRLVALFWMFTSVVIVSGFIASMNSALTVGQLQTAVHGPEDLPRVRVGTIADSTSEAFLRRREISFAAYPDARAAVGALEAGRLDAVVYDAPLLRYEIQTRGAVSIKVLPEVLERQSYAIALRSGSPLREEVNRAVLKITAQQAWRDTLRRYLGE
jgi:polar amino acid transport system substrate-binding protein